MHYCINAAPPVTVTVTSAAIIAPGY
jgi:hypothetical protein